MKKLYILDAVSFLFRSYYAIGQMTNKRGESTNALYGFIRSVQKIIKDFAPTNLVAVFDGPDNKQARTKIYEHYKANRTGMPEDLFPQIDLALEYCAFAGIPTITESGVEADDMIGAVAKWAEAEEAEIYICSSDKDLCQLVSDRIFMLNTHKDNLLIDRQKVEEIYGVKPEQIVDYLAIMGDKSDNIPGIPGFGPKTASSLLQEYGSLENLLNHLDSMSNQKRADKIREHKEDALMSQRLATLILDIPFPKDKSFFSLKAPDVPKLNELYRDMNFSTLLKELGQEGNVPPIEDKPSPPAEKTVTYTIVDDEAALSALMKQLQTQKSLSIDTETTALHPMEAELVGIGIAAEPQTAWYIPTNGKLGIERVLAAIKPLLANPHIAFYGHNIKYDIHILKNHDTEIANVGFDTMLASYLLNSQNNRHSLDQITLEKFGKVKTPISDLIGTGKKQKSMRDVPIEEVGPYCCEDVDYTCRLKKLFEQEIENRHLEKILYEIEIPLIPVLVAMERFGMYVNKKHLQNMSAEMASLIAGIEQEIYAFAGEEFNIKSPKQLAEILFEKLEIKTGVKKKSTRAEILESLKRDYPIAGKVLEFRTFEKLRSTYIDTLPLQINLKTNRIHCSFMQSVTATGRLSCQDPNLQNIPIRTSEGKKIREAFKPDHPDWSYLAADYSQIELRLLAHLSEDPTLITAFENSEDIHASTASAVFDIPIEEVTPKMRSQAKAVNFGIIYGQQAFGLSQILGIEVKEASSFIKKYFQRYPQIQAFLERCKQSARDTGLAVTMTGRQRPIPEINSSNGMIRAAAERLAVNTPLQGSQADIIKKAMIEIYHALKEECLGHMVLQIHDELIFELPDQNIDPVKKLVVDIMENIVELKVPLTVNIAIGKNWGEC